MAKRVNITLHEELFQRLQRVKPRFNVSGVCQQAIEHEVRRQELLIEAKDDMRAVVEKYRQEKRSFMSQYHDMGYEVGVNFVNSGRLEYGEIIELVKEYEIASAEESLDTDDPAVVYHSEFWKESDSACDLRDEIQDQMSDEPDLDEGTFLSGWLEGVAGAWEKIKDKV